MLVVGIRLLSAILPFNGVLWGLFPDEPLPIPVSDGPLPVHQSELNSASGSVVPGTQPDASGQPAVPSTNLEQPSGYIPQSGIDHAMGAAGPKETHLHQDVIPFPYQYADPKTLHVAPETLPYLPAVPLNSLAHPEFTYSGFQPIAILPPVFVHERRTVRVSQRLAELTVQLPENVCSKFTINSEDYNGNGQPIIFRTRVATLYPKRYYVSASYLNPHSGQWEQLPAPTLPTDETGQYFVDLTAGTRQTLVFIAPESAWGQTGILENSSSTRSTNNADSTEQAAKEDSESMTLIRKLSEEIDKQSAQISELLKTQNQGAIEEQAQETAKERVVNRFYFTQESMLLEGKCLLQTNTNDVTQIEWKQFPTMIVVAAPADLQPQPPLPFTAILRLQLKDREENVLSTLPDHTITFSRSGEHLVAEVATRTFLLNQIESIARKSTFLRSGQFVIGATLEFQNTGNLRTETFRGQLHNSIQLVLHNP